MRRLVLLAAAALLAGCHRAPTRTNEVVSTASREISTDASSSIWDAAPEHLANLLPQDLVDPRILKPTTAEVRVRSVHNGGEIAFRLEWIDRTNDDMPGPARFLDGCAVQIPRGIEPNPPDPRMGQGGRPVEIAFWRADWQAAVNGRKDTIQAIYPNAAVDHYPFQAKSLEGTDAQKQMETRYAPARAVGNHRAGPRDSPVEDLVAEGPGTLSPAGARQSRGKGARTNDGWAVVIARKLPEGLGPNKRTQIAFAVWEGSSKETGARKMRTGWIPLAVRAAR